MRKYFLTVLVCMGLLVAGLNICHAKNLDKDVWIYTNDAGTQYYLKDYGIAARSWCYALVVRVDKSGNATNLVYRLESGYDGYSVFLGTSSSDVVKRDARSIEKGKTSGDIVASTIWNKYVGPLDAERWARIDAQEGRRR